MVIRDPFNIHGKHSAVSILRAAATQAAIGITEKAVEAGINAIEKGKQTAEEMSFQIPKNVPSFSNPQRVLEDQHWASGGSSMTARFGGRSSQTLPMYKDKPYAYPPSRRHRPAWRRKRVIGLVFLVLSLLYYFGAFSPNHDTDSVRPSWSWLKSSDNGNQADWLDRRERVVDAFKLSWDAYDRYAWGEFSPLHARISIHLFGEWFFQESDRRMEGEKARERETMRQNKSRDSPC
jgi:endoplasmic reticulum Man9GlcNAc2 1,2-alpha-mannosidase